MHEQTRINQWAKPGFERGVHEYEAGRPEYPKEAVEPVEAMRKKFQTLLPQIEIEDGTAEAINIPYTTHAYWCEKRNV